MNILVKCYELFYAPRAEKKLETAEKLWALCGAELTTDPCIAQLLRVLCASQEHVRQQMCLMDMDRTCSRCALERGGGCCSAAFAEETDVLQLLMNMMAGVGITGHHTAEDNDCRYLGERGCIFRFKPMFCLNYICPSIKEYAQPDALERLEKQTGILLQAQQEMEKLLIDFFLRISRRQKTDFLA